MDITLVSELSPADFIHYDMDCSECNDMKTWRVPYINNLFLNDPMLKEFEKDIRMRYACHIIKCWNGRLMLQDFYGRNRLMAVIIWKSDNV